MTLRRRVTKCASCHGEIIVTYPDDVSNEVVKQAMRTEHRLKKPWCKAKEPRLLWVSDEPVKE